MYIPLDLVQVFQRSSLRSNRVDQTLAKLTWQRVPMGINSQSFYTGYWLRNLALSTENSSADLSTCISSVDHAD